MGKANKSPAKVAAKYGKDTHTRTNLYYNVDAQVHQASEIVKCFRDFRVVKYECFWSLTSPGIAAAGGLGGVLGIGAGPGSVGGIGPGGAGIGPGGTGYGPGLGVGPNAGGAGFGPGG